MVPVDHHHCSVAALLWLLQPVIWQLLVEYEPVVDFVKVFIVIVVDTGLPLPSAR